MTMDSPSISSSHPQHYLHAFWAKCLGSVHRRSAKRWKLLQVAGRFGLQYHPQRKVLRHIFRSLHSIHALVMESVAIRRLL